MCVDGRQEHGDERTLRVLLSMAEGTHPRECNRLYWCAPVDIPVACRGGSDARHKLGEGRCGGVRNGLRAVGGAGSGARAECWRRGRRRCGARLLANAGPGDGRVTAEAIAGAGAGIEYAGKGVKDAAAVRASGIGGVAKGTGRGKITTGGDERAGEQRWDGTSSDGEHSADSAGVDRGTDYETGRKPTDGRSE